MPPLDETDLIGHTRIDATLWEDSRYAYTKHTYYGWRKEAVEEYTWRRGYKPIGQGGFGAVFREECTEGPQKGAVRAVKHIQKPPQSQLGSRIDYSRELEAIARFSRPQYSPFFVRSEGWYDGEETVCIIMELLPHGSLQQCVGTALPEGEVKVLIAQVLQGVSHMHREGYAHRDLKPPNLLVVHPGPTWQIKIADFGLSKQIIDDSSSLRTVAGTTSFMAPEVQGIGPRADDSDSSDDERKQSSYTSAVDVWAVGVISFLLLTGAFPFPAGDHKALRRYTQGRASFPHNLLQDKAMSDSGRSFVQNLMHPSPSSRPSADSSLQHAWFRHDVVPDTTSTGPTISTGLNSQAVQSNASASWNTDTTNDSGYQTVLGNIGSEDDAGRREMSHSRSTVSQHSGAKTPIHDGNTKSDLDSAVELNNVLLSLPDSVQKRRSGRKDFKTPPPGIDRKASLRKRYTIGRQGSRPRGVWISQIAFSPDSRVLATICTQPSYPYEHEIKTWDLSTGKELSTFGPMRIHGGCKFSPDGTRLVFIEGPDSTVAQVDIASGQIHRLEKIPPGQRSVTFSPDGSLATSSTEGLVLRDGVTGKRIRSLEANSENVVSVAFSPDGRMLACMHGRSPDLTYNLTIWDVSTGLQVFQMKMSKMRFHFSADSKAIAVVGEDNRAVELVDIATRKTIRTFACQWYVRAIALSLDGVFLAVTTLEHSEGGRHRHITLQLWDVGTDEEVSCVDLEDNAFHVEFSPDSKLLAVGPLGGIVELYDIIRE